MGGPVGGPGEREPDATRLLLPGESWGGDAVVGECVKQTHLHRALKELVGHEMILQTEEPCGRGREMRRQQ